MASRFTDKVISELQTSGLRIEWDVPASIHSVIVIVETGSIANLIAKAWCTALGFGSLFFPEKVDPILGEEQEF